MWFCLGHFSCNGSRPGFEWLLVKVHGKLNDMWIHIACQFPLTTCRSDQLQFQVATAVRGINVSGWVFESVPSDGCMCSFDYYNHKTNIAIQIFSVFLTAVLHCSRSSWALRVILFQLTNLIFQILCHQWWLWTTISCYNLHWYISHCCWKHHKNLNLQLM